MPDATALEQLFQLQVRLNAPVGTLIPDPTPYNQQRRPVINLIGGSYSDDPVNNQGVLSLPTALLFSKTTTSGSAQVAQTYTLPNNTCVFLFVEWACRHDATPANAGGGSLQVIATNNGGAVTLAIVSGPTQGHVGTDPQAASAVTVTATGTTLNVNVVASGATLTDWQGTVRLVGA